MMNFDDLKDEIEVDDWLIPRGDITRRKLIKQTSRFKIYKADWFGDVLVYEPIKRAHNLASRRHSHRAGQRASGELSHSKMTYEIDHEALNFKLKAEICKKPSSCAMPSKPLSYNNDDDDDDDSAYSSISTTPHANSECEFQFPATQVTQTTLSGASTVSSQQEIKSTGKFSCLSPPVVLNRDSFTFSGHYSCNSDKLDNHAAIENKKQNVMSACEEDQTPVRAPETATIATTTTTTTTSSGYWFELNELRLVAHENFMLFMGASLDTQGNLAEEARTMDESLERNASYVMQMSHPKSVSLRDLLHANNNSSTHTTSCNGAYSSTSSSPIDRFFGARSRAQPRPSAHLTVEAKLNICQQVTNAMTYLHEKNIVHGRLTSVNIYIELNQRVKISLLDNDEQQIVAATGNHDEPQACRLNLPALTYLSPELIRSLQVVDDENCDDNNNDRDNQKSPPIVCMDTRLITRAADIFAFGTLLYELFEERFPFAAAACETLAVQTPPATPPTAFASPEARHAANSRLFDTLCLESARSPTLSPGLLSTPNEQHRRQRRSFAPHTQGNIKLSASELIYQIGSGQIAAKNASNTPLVDHIISACWAHEAHARPSFKQLKFE